MASRPIINRNYICRLCGKIRRAPAHYIPEAPDAPECCGATMRLLAYEATVVANRMDEAERLEWLRSGGRFAKVAGRRRWKRAGRSTP